MTFVPFRQTLIKSRFPPCTPVHPVVYAFCRQLIISALFRRNLSTTGDRKTHFSPVQTFQKQVVPVDTPLDQRSRLPIFRHKLMGAVWLVFPHNYGSRRTNLNFEVWIFVINGGVNQPRDNSIVRLNLGPYDRQRHCTAFDCHGSRSRTHQQHQRKQEPATHRNLPSIARWPQATGFGRRPTAP